MTSNYKIETPEKIVFPEDARKLPEAMDAHNSWIKKTRSGHVIEINDNKGAEHITIQHRGGTMLQFQPDGTLYIGASNGFYQMVFGENRLYMTGAYDIVVKGDASLKVDGDYNVTIAGDYNLTVDGDLNSTIGNNRVNMIVGDEINVIGRNQSTKVADNIEVRSKGKLLLASSEDVRMLTYGILKIETTSGIDINAAGNIDIDSNTGTNI